METGRRDMRYQHALSIVLTAGKTKLRTATEDVSFSGLFATVDAALTTRQLVRVDAQLPDGSHFSSHAMVVFAREPAEGRRAGVGLKLFGLSREALEHWVRFVCVVRDQQAARPIEPAESTTQTRAQQAAVVLRVRPQGLDTLFEVYTRDLATGGMFLETDQPLLIGSHLMAEIVHPDTHEVFELPCVVRRVVKGPPAGLGVEFTGLDEARRQQLHEFVSSVAPQYDFTAFDEIVQA